MDNCSIDDGSFLNVNQKECTKSCNTPLEYLDNGDCKLCNFNIANCEKCEKYES